MYIVLGVLYGSFIRHITIICTLPLAGIGQFALNMAGACLDILRGISIVKKSAIVMIDFALEVQRVDGLNARDAVLQACLLRLRRILMTTAAAMFGALPSMPGRGVGSELRRPLDLAIVGGLAISQVPALFTVHVIYLFFERIGVSLEFGAASGVVAAEAP